ncbi:MAG: response regulator, partial [Desulfobulbaceae bacterium]|nr:response regulator [Desulfobulbaceae bacterium]
MKKVLVVDNSATVLRFMKNLLTGKGYEVTTAIDGLSALKILDSFSPDIIFIDLVMPNITGDKLCRIIRGMPRFRETFLVILSAAAVEQGLDF